MSAIVATKPEQEGTAIMDGETALEFIVGFTAGLTEVEPHVAILGILAFEAVQEVALHGRGELFKRQHGQSIANSIVDHLAMITGVYLGHYIRATADAREFAANPETALAPPVAGYP
jgi:hypothetical protein